MTRAEAIDILKNTIVRFGRTNGKTVYAEALQMAIKALEEPQWILCSERLPEEGQIVLATHLGGLDPHRQVIEHIYDHGEFLLNWEMDMDMLSPTFGQRYMGEVIAWMPLPEPHKGEKE